MAGPVKDERFIDVVNAVRPGRAQPELRIDRQGHFLVEQADPGEDRAVPLNIVTPSIEE